MLSSFRPNSYELPHYSVNLEKLGVFCIIKEMANQSPKKPQKNPKKQPPRRGWRSFFGGPSFFGNLLTVIIIFLFIMSAYSLVASYMQPSNQVPLSQVATDVEAGKVSAITVNGDNLDLVYVDGAHKTSRKDPSAGLPETLATYGVTPSELSKVAITIQGQSGLAFWAINLAPIILPLLFIGFLFWFLT